jgi:hypothetical protein
MSEQKIKKSLKQKLLKFSELALVFLFATFMAIVMAFYYDELGLALTTTLIIVAVALFLPNFLRRNFNTDKKRNLEMVKALDYQDAIGSFFWTKADKSGLFPYKEFNTSFVKSAKEQVEGKVFYIDFKAKCLIAFVQVLHMIFLPFAFVYIANLKNPLISIFATLIVTIFLVKSYDKTRNFIIRKSAKNINPSNNN